MIPVSVTYQVNGQPSMLTWVIYLHVSLVAISLFIQGADDPSCDWRGLMILDQPRKYCGYEIDGVPGKFSAIPDGIKVSTHAFE